MAIKELISAVAGDEATLKRFLAEARPRCTARQADRRHLMEYLPGGSLEDRLPQER